MGEKSVGIYVAHAHTCERGHALIDSAREECKFVCEDADTQMFVCACVCVSLNVGSKWVLTSHKPFLLPDFTVTDCKRRRANKRAKLTVSSD